MMKRRALLWTVAGLVLLAVAWRVVVPQETKWAAGDALRARGQAALLGTGEREALNTLDEIVLRAKPMAKTAVPGENLSFSFTFKHAIWPGMDGSGGYAFGSLIIYGFNFEGDRNAISGKYVWNVSPPNLSGGLPSLPVNVTCDLPATHDDIYWAEIECSVTLSGDSATRLTASDEPIGDKAATHAKEHVITEEWFLPAGTEYTWVIGEHSGTSTVPTDTTATLSVAVSGGGLDCDDWTTPDAGLEGVKYVMSLENIQFGAAEIDTSTFEATTWGGTAASVDKLWAEGFGGNCIGFWASEPFYNGAYVYNTFTGGTINAPYVHDFSNIYIRDMAGRELDPKVSFACIRNISDGEDLGERTELLSWFKANSPFIQTSGCYWWDTNPADVTGDMRGWIDRTSAKDLYFEIGLTDPAYKVEGAGFGLTFDGETPVPGPYDGLYAEVGEHNGETAYSNGHGLLYLHDAAGPDWAIGPGPPAQPYYLQSGGGPAGAYLVNTTDYTDDIIDAETGQRRFSGLAGEGVGPAVSTTTERRVTDESAPGFDHDLTLLLDGWGVDATSRTASPYRTILGLTHRASIGIYQDAHDHTDWAGTNATAPDANGDFTVTAAGGSIRLELASNYVARQATPKGTDYPDEVPVPTCYWSRTHDACYGQGTADDNHEAVYCWLGWGYLRQRFQVPALTTITCRIEYYYDLDGIGDNHISANKRQTEYTYSTGDLQTLERVITLRYKDALDWAPVLIDLLDRDLPECALVTAIEWEFADAGSYKLEEPSLVNDPGDPQEATEDAVTSGLVGTRTVGGGFVGGGPMGTVTAGRRKPTLAGLAIKHFDAWRYAQGGTSGHYNGAHKSALVCPDFVKGNAEKTVGMLNVLIGDESGLDLTTCFALSAWASLINLCLGDAWEATYSSAADVAMTTDSESTALKTLVMSDIVPQMTGGAPSTAIRCFSWQAVRGLPYTWYGTHWVKGRAHGLAWQVNTDYRARGKGRVCFARTIEPDATSPLYEWIGGAARPDQHGHWASPALAPMRHRPRPTRQWHYVAQEQTETDPHDLGYCPTRELQATNVDYAPVGLCDLVLDAAGNPVWAACELDGTVTLYALNDTMLWKAGSAPFADDYTLPSACVRDDGSVLVAATNDAETRIEVRCTRQHGDTWEAINTAFGDTLRNGKLFCRGGQVYLPGWYNNKVWLVTSSSADLTREVMDGTNTILEVCSCVVVPGADIPICSGTFEDDGRILVAVARGDGTDTYECRNFRDGFTLLA